MERLAAAEEASDSKQKKKKKKKKKPDEDSEEEQENERVSLTEPFIKKLRGTEALKAMVRTTRFCYIIWSRCRHFPQLCGSFRQLLHVGGAGREREG